MVNHKVEFGNFILPLPWVYQMMPCLMPSFSFFSIAIVAKTADSVLRVFAVFWCRSYRCVLHKQSRTWAASGTGQERIEMSKCDWFRFGVVILHVIGEYHQLCDIGKTPKHLLAKACLNPIVFCNNTFSIVELFHLNEGRERPLSSNVISGRNSSSPF